MNVPGNAEASKVSCAEVTSRHCRQGGQRETLADWEGAEEGERRCSEDRMEGRTDVDPYI